MNTKISIKDSVHWYVRGGNRIHRTAVIYWDWVKMGTGNVIGEYCVIGSPGELLGKGEDDYIGRVWIGDNNRINSYVSIDRPYQDEATELRNDNLIMRHSHVGHDARIGSNCLIRTGTMIGGGAVLENHVNTGLNSSIRDHVRVGESAFIGMGSVLVKYLEPFWIAVGNPARPIKDNTRQIQDRNLTINQVNIIRKRWKLGL